MKLNDFATAVLTLRIASPVNELIDTRSLREGVAEIRRLLLQKLVQEVPETLSVCEFDCPRHSCAVRDCAGCVHQPRIKPHGYGIN